MDSRLINKILKEDSFTSIVFKGVYSIDTIPSKINDNHFAIVVNSDIQGNPGLHWIALYASPTHLIYFDSLGPTLINNSYLTNFILSHSKNRKFMFSLQPVQCFISSTCGYYVLSFILYMARGYTLRYFENLFNDADLLENDRTVCTLLTRKYKDIMDKADCGIAI